VSKKVVTIAWYFRYFVQTIVFFVMNQCSDHSESSATRSAAKFCIDIGGAWNLKRSSCKTYTFCVKFSYFPELGSFIEKLHHIYTSIYIYINIVFSNRGWIILTTGSGRIILGRIWFFIYAHIYCSCVFLIAAQIVSVDSWWKIALKNVQERPRSRTREPSIYIQNVLPNRSRCSNYLLYFII
jgi:hypothetical protein